MQSSWILPIIIILAACTVNLYLADCPMEKVCAPFTGSDLEYCQDFFKRKTMELPSCMCDSKYTASADRKAVEYVGPSSEPFSTFLSKCVAACKKATQDSYYQRRGTECRCRCPTLDDIP
ncbi:unnamed protein product, partial [Adineta ricciae]